MVFRGVPIAVFSVCLLCSAHAAAPTASVTSVVFSDLDLDSTEIGGTVTWTAPADTSQVTKYNVYVATDALGAGKSVVALNVPIGTNTTNLIENTSMGSFMYVVVMTANADGEQTNAPGSTPLEDQVAVISSLAFEDLDLDADAIGGTVRWNLRGTAPVLKFFVYLADDGSGLNKVLLSEVLTGTSFDISADTTYGTHSYICVYAASSLGEASSPSAIQFYDVNSPVRSLAFTDLDLDVDELGGRISWIAPLDVVDVTGYVVSRSTDAAGAARDNIGTYAVGSAGHDVPVNTGLGTFAYYNVFSKSSLAERTAPVSISVVDNFANASEIVFQDLDLDSGELGGVVSWNPATDQTYVTSYALYYAKTAAGDFRSGRVGAASLELERAIHNGTQKANYQYFVVYASSSLAEQSTPAFLAITDVESTTTRPCTTGPCSWTVGDWGTCSTACGEGIGTQSRTVACSSVDEGACNNSTQPDLSRPCSGWCPWTVSAWGACSTSCGQGVGTQTRNVTCSSSNASACDTSVQPPAAGGCSSLCPWVTGPWSACNCRRGTRARKVTCSANTRAECESNKPDLLQACDNCGCGDGGKHDAMRPWGHGPMGTITCDTQWWVIFFIIVGSLLLFFCCVALCYCVYKPESVTLPEEKAQPDAEKVGGPEGCNVKVEDIKTEWEV